MNIDVTILFYAIRNTSPTGGWLPMYSVDGHQYGDTYARTSYTQAEALQLARMLADAEAQRYAGDWNIIIKKGISE